MTNKAGLGLIFQGLASQPRQNKNNARHNATKQRGGAPARAACAARRSVFQGKAQQNQECVNGAYGVHEHDEFASSHHALLTKPDAQARFYLKLGRESVDGGKRGSLIGNK